MLSVSRVFSFSPTTDRPAAPPPLRPFFFREFQLYGRTGKGRHACRWRLDCQAQEPAAATTTWRACRQANDFNSVPLSRHRPRVLSSSHHRLLFLRLIPSNSISQNLLRIGFVATNVAEYLDSQRKRPPCFDMLVHFAGNGRMLKYRENWW